MTGPPFNTPPGRGPWTAASRLRGVDSGVILVSQNIGQTASQANTTTPSFQATSPGNLMVAFYARSGGQATGALSSVTDSSGGSWTLATRGAVVSVSNTRIECWYRENCPSITSVTFNSGTAQTNSWDITEWSGMVLSGALDVASPDNSATASSTTVTTPTVVPTQITDLVLAAFHCGQTTTSGLTPQFAELTQFDDAAVGTGRAAWLVDKGAGPYSASWTLGAAKACGVITVAFKVVGGVNAPAAPPPQATPLRRARWFIRGGGYATQPVPPQVVVAVVPPPPDVRAPRRRWLPKPRPRVASPPWTVTVTVPPQPVRGRLTPPRRRKPFIAAPVTVQAALPPQPVRDRLQPPRPRRSRSTLPVPPQVVVVTAQALPPQPGRPVRAPWLPRGRAHRAEPVWPPQAVVLHPVPPQQGRAVRPWLPKPRARSAQPLPSVTVYVQQPTRDRLLPPLLRRQRSAAPVPAQVVVQTVQALPPQPGRPTRPSWLPRSRGRRGEPPWPLVVVVSHPVPPQPPRVKRPWWLPRSRAKKYEPGWPQGVGPSFTVGVLSARTDRTGGPD